MICLNCNTRLSEHDNYCRNCGGKAIRNRLTLKNLFADFSQQFLNYDNTFLKTFIGLFTKPEEVIGGYVNGVRKKYVSAITYFAIALTLSGFQIFILNKFFPEAMNIEDFSPDNIKEMQQTNFQFAQEYQSILYMLLVPFYALITKLVFFNIKKYNYTELVVINMYLSAHFSIVSALFVVAAASLGFSYLSSGMLIIILQILYSTYVFKQLYKMSLKNILLRFILFMAIIVVIFILATIAMAIIMYLNGDLQKAFESGKAASGA